MQYDWLVSDLWSTTTLVIGGANAALPLLPPPDFAAIDPGLPDGDAYDIFIKRIVGQIEVRGDLTVTESTWQYSWRIMPLALDEEAGDIDTPWTNFSIYDEDQANLRWWAERNVMTIAPPAANLIIGLDVVDHPWHSFVDLHPNQWVGQNSRLWPALCFQNHQVNDGLRVRARLRMYVGYK